MGKPLKSNHLRGNGPGVSHSTFHTYNGRPIPFWGLKRGFNTQNGEVKVVKPADPEKLRLYHESRKNS